MNRRDFLSLFSLLLAPPWLAYGATGAFFWQSLLTGKISGNLDQIPVGTPGSIMKLITCALLLEEKILPSFQRFECRGQRNINGITYKCQIPHGKLDLQQALAHSCNIYFAQAAELISPNLFIEYLRLFGLNPSRLKPGLLKLRPVQELVLGSNTQLELSALELLKLATIIAKGNQGGSAQFASPTWSFLQEGMKLAGRQGTGKFLDPSNELQVALKTGTTAHGNKFQSWVIGYFPYGKPKYSFCARSFQGTSQSSAVPLARAELFAKTWP